MLSHDSTVTVVCATDDEYSMPLAVMLYSLLVHRRAGGEVDIHVIDDGVSPRHREKIESIVDPFNATIQWILPPRHEVADLRAGTWYTRTTYYRLLVPELVPEATKVLYLDCDLVVQEDLVGLWEHDVQGHAFLAAQDQGYPTIASAPHLVACPDLEAEGSAEYFNAGVMLMNLTRWRQSDLAGRVIAFLRTWHETMQCADQDGLNAVAHGQWGKLDDRWNQSIPTWEVTNDVVPRADGIIHFMGPHKPWSSKALYPSRKLFERYLRASGWHTDAEWLLYRTAKAAGRLHHRLVNASTRWVARLRSGFSLIRRSALRTVRGSGTLHE